MKSKLPLLICLLLFIQSQVFAQKEANNWYFGTKAGFSFSSGCPVPLSNGAMVTLGGSAVMSDKNTGELLFYTNGRNIWDRTHQPMPNASDYTADCSNAITQPTLIVPVPENEHLYYVFSSHFVMANGGGEETVICSTKPLNKYSMNVRYSVVDMRLNEGKGDVVAKQKRILLQANSTEKLTAVPHTNGRDYWLLTHEWNSDAFYVYLISSEGVSEPSVQHIGSVHEEIAATAPVNYQEIQGSMKASPDGKKLACAIFTHMGHSEDSFDLFDFNDGTGVLSNYVDLGSFSGQYGISFSPDNSKLYVSTYNHEEPHYSAFQINQYDLLAGDTEAIIASKQRVIADRLAKGYSAWGIDLQLAPDGKLYAVSESGSLMGGDGITAAVIHKPNEKAPDCDIEFTTFDFEGGAFASGFPNFIQSYFNGLEPTSCSGEGECATFSLSIYPNPTTGTVKFMRDGDCGDVQTFHLRIVNSIGQVVSKEIKGLTIAGEVDISGYAAGLYVFVITFPDGKRVVRKVVKVS